MSVTNYKELKGHVGHKVECVSYGRGLNVAIECVTCMEVLMSFDKPDKRRRKKLRRYGSP